MDPIDNTIDLVVDLLVDMGLNEGVSPEQFNVILDDVVSRAKSDARICFREAWEDAL